MYLFMHNRRKVFLKTVLNYNQYSKNHTPNMVFIIKTPLPLPPTVEKCVQEDVPGITYFMPPDRLVKQIERIGERGERRWNEISWKVAYCRLSGVLSTNASVTYFRFDKEDGAFSKPPPKFDRFGGINCRRALTTLWIFCLKNRP